MDPIAIIGAVTSALVTFAGGVKWLLDRSERLAKEREQVHAAQTDRVLATFSAEQSAARADHKEATAGLVAQLGRTAAAVEASAATLAELRALVLSRPCMVQQAPVSAPTPPAPRAVA